MQPATPPPDAPGAGPAGPGLAHLGPVFANLAPAELVERALARGEGSLTVTGALAVATGARTGRSPQDKFFVREPGTETLIDWGKVNQPLAPAAFERLFAKVAAYLQARPLFQTDGYACADPRHRLNVRVIADRTWHALLAHFLV